MQCPILNKCLLKLLALALLTSGTFRPTISYAMNIVRDAEIERYLQDLSRPIFLAANMKSGKIGIYLITHDAMNAFVTSGTNMFIFTSLITFSDNSDALLGVMAHETGHIARGHLIRSAANNTTEQHILVSILAAAAAALSRNPHIALGLSTAILQMGVRSHLAYSRMHEMEADSAALRYLTKIKRSNHGIYDFMSYLNDSLQKEWYYKYIDPYTVTHPMPVERLSHFRIASEQRNSNSVSISRDPKLEHRHRRVKAKIIGLWGEKYVHFNPYPTGKPDPSTVKYDDFYTEYKKLHSSYQSGDYNTAMRIVDKLMSNYPNDPYIYNMKAHLVFTQKKFPEAIKYFRMATKLESDNLLLQYDLAKALMATSAKEELNEAIGIIRAFAISEPFNASPHRDLAAIYQKLGDKITAKIELAEEAFILGDCTTAIIHASSIKNKTHKTRAQEIIDQCKSQ